MTGILPRYRKIRLDAGVQPPQTAVAPTRQPPVPDEILRYIAGPFTLSPPVHGICSTVLFLHAPSKDYVLKRTQGEYRGSELEAEYAALLHYRQMADPRVPVAEPYMFVRHADDSYLLTSRYDGEPIAQVLQSAAEHERACIIRQMASALAAIHRCGKIDHEDWRTCLQEQLRFAQMHLRNGSLDPAEFIHDGQPVDPAAVLRRLHDQVPQPGPLCVLHGDYRPKNLLWDRQTQTISAVLDWAFCDIGDPYYDLAIVLYYMRTEAERSLFLASYGLPRIDEQRLRYFEDLSKFLNV